MQERHQGLASLRSRWRARRTHSPISAESISMLEHKLPDPPANMDTGVPRSVTHDFASGIPRIRLDLLAGQGSNRSAMRKRMGSLSFSTGSGLVAILLWSTTIALARSLSEQLGPLTAAASVLPLRRRALPHPFLPDESSARAFCSTFRAITCWVVASSSSSTRSCSIWPLDWLRIGSKRSRSSWSTTCGPLRPSCSPCRY